MSKGYLHQTPVSKSKTIEKNRSSPQLTRPTVGGGLSVKTKDLY